MSRYTLLNADSIQAKAGTGGGAINYTISSGDEITSGTEVFKILAQGQLTTSVASLYSPGSATKTGIIQQVAFANTTGSDVDNCFVYVNGTATGNQETGKFKIPANGSAFLNKEGLKVLDANGALVTTVLLVATGDATGTLAGGVLPLTFATVNSNTGSFGDATHAVVFTVNGKGLITAASTTAITGLAESAITNLVTDLASKFEKVNGTLTGGAAPTYANGKLVYDTDNDSLTFFNSDSNISLQIGQEQWIRVKNVSGSTIPNGSAVYITGANSGFPTVALAKADSATTSNCVGLATEALTNNSIGFITGFGVVHNLDTSGFSAGATVYLSAATAGLLTATRPSAPNFSQRIGVVAVSDASVGTVHVFPAGTGLGFGAANQVLGMNAGATGQEYKTNSATAPLTLTNGANTQAWALTAGSPGQVFNYFPSTAAWTAVDHVFNIQAFGADPTGAADASLAIYNAIICCGIQKGATKQVITTAQVATGTTFNISVQANSLAATGTMIAQTTTGLIGFTYTGGGTGTIAATTTWGITGGNLLSGSIIGVPTSLNGTLAIGGIVHSPPGFYVINNQVINSIPGVQFTGPGANSNHDTGSWPLAGGSWWSYRGTAGGAALINVPITGSSGIQGGQALGGIKVMDMNFDLSSNSSGTVSYGNGGYGVMMLSCVGYHMENLFVFNATKSAYEFSVLGNGALNEAHDCSRGTHINLKFRQLEGKSTGANISASLLTNPAATTNLNALSASTVTLSGAPNANWDTAGVARFQAIDSLTGSVMWYLVNYTGISGSTLTGCTAVNQFPNQANSTTLNAATPASANPKPNATMFAGSKIVPAQGAWGDGMTWHGSATANACCSTFIQLTGTYFMGGGIYSANSDSMTVIRPMFNRTTAGTPTGIGIELHGSTLSGASGASGSSRNQFFISGDPGLGGINVRGTDTLGYLQPAATNKWDYYELGNGAPIPISGTNAHFIWTANGGLQVGVQSTSSAAQVTAASFTGFITGTTIVVPPQGIQIGTTFRWVIPVSKTLAGTTYTVQVRWGTTNTFAGDTVAIASQAMTGTAAVDAGQLEIIMTVATIGGSATAFAQQRVTHNLAATGISTTGTAGSLQSTMTMTAFNSGLTNPGPAFLNVAISANAANVFTFGTPVTAEVIKAANP